MAFDVAAAYQTVYTATGDRYFLQGGLYYRPYSPYQETTLDESAPPGTGAFSSLTGNPTDHSGLAAALDNVEAGYDMPSTVIDVTKVEPNVLALAASSITLTFSATPTTGTEFSLEIIGHTVACTVTIPSCYSELQQKSITTFTVPANAKVTVFFRRTTGSETRLIGEPVASESAAESIASAATTNIAGALSRCVNITGTTTITSFGTADAGTFRYGKFAGAASITSGASLVIAGVASGTTVTLSANDGFQAFATAADTWFVWIQRGALPQIVDTWANIKGKTPATGTKAFATDLFGGIELFYNGTRWRAVAKYVVAFADGTTYALPDTGSIAEQLLAHATLLLPADFIGPKDSIYVEWTADHTLDAGSNNVQMRLRVDTSSTGVTGTAISQRTGVNATGTTRRNNVLRCNNSVSSQTLFNGETSSMESSNAIATATINFAVDQYFKFCFKQATATTGLPQLRGFTISILQGN